MTSIASPQTFAGALAADIRLAAMIQAQVQLKIADMSSLRQYIDYLGDISGTGSNVVRARFTDLGAASPMSAVADGTDLTPSAMDGSVADVTVSRSGLAYSISDLFSMSGLGRDIDPFFIADALAKSAEARMNQLICTAFSGATASVGTSGVDLDMDDWLEALYTLEQANNGGRISCVLSQKQFTDFQKALRSENNNFLAFAPATEEMSKAKPNGFAGEILGVSVFRSAYVQNDGGATNHVGLMFGEGGLGYATGSPTLTAASAEFRPGGSPVIVEMDRNALGGVTRVVGHLYMGCSILQQDKVCKIVTSNS